MGLLFILMLAAAAAGFGHAILGPFEVAARGKPRPKQFILSDFLCLMVWAALPMPLLAAAQHWRGNDTLLFALIAVALVAIFVFVWWHGATMLSALGILDAKRRSIFLLVILPAAVPGSMIAVPGLIVMVLDFMLDRHGPNVGGFLLCTVAITALFLVAFALRRLGERILTTVRES